MSYEDEWGTKSKEINNDYSEARRSFINEIIKRDDQAQGDILNSRDHSSSQPQYPKDIPSNNKKALKGNKGDKGKTSKSPRLIKAENKNTKKVKEPQLIISGSDTVVTKDYVRDYFKKHPKCTEVQIYFAKKVEKDAFKGFKQLKSVKTYNVQEFEAGAFANCPNLVININNVSTPPKISPSAFNGVNDSYFNIY